MDIYRTAFGQSSSFNTRPFFVSLLSVLVLLSTFLLAGAVLFMMAFATDDPHVTVLNLSFFLILSSAIASAGISAAIGLWKGKFWGWYAVQAVSLMWLFGSIIASVWFLLASASNPYALDVAFQSIFQAVFPVIVTTYLLTGRPLAFLGISRSRLSAMLIASGVAASFSMGIVILYMLLFYVPRLLTY